MTGAVIRASKSTAVRYERARPGELVHMDVKKLGRIPEGGGWRAHGRGNTGLDPNRRNGFDYVHSLVDDHCRLAYSEILPDEKGLTCADFLRRAAEYFRSHGITTIEQVMTDNAWAYRYSLRQVCTELGARQVFIKPHCPWQNGKVERLNRTLQTEWAYRQRLHLATPNAPQPLHPGSTTTTLNDVTAHSADCRPSADCNQRHDPVHLVGGAIVPDQVDILNWGAAVRSNAAEPIAGRVCFFVMTKGHKEIHGCPDGR